MRKPFLQTNHTIAAVLAVVVIACLFPLASGHAASKSDSQAFPTDSLVRMAAGYYEAEPSVQEILNDLDPDLLVSDLLLREWFCASPGGIAVGVIAGYSSLTAQVSLHWYPKGSPGDMIAVLPAEFAPGDSGIFFLSAPDSIGWCLRGPTDNVWYSEPELNSDSRRHVRFYATGESDTYLMFWEDMALLGDADFNDLVVRVRFPNASPELELSSSLDASGTENTICLSVSADGSSCSESPITVRMLAGPGEFPPVTDYGSVSASHCFAPSGDGLYTFVFEASAAGAVPDIDTLIIPMLSAALTSSGPEVAVNLNNNFTICRPETLIVPFSVTSSCQLTGIHTYAPAYINLADSTVRVFTGVPFESCLYIVAQDACGGKDSAMVCFNISVSTPTTITCPANIDTTLCEPGYACYSFTVSGGAPPITVTAIPPTYYNSTMHQVCYPINASGVYSAKTIVKNATCPPETSVTVIHAMVNTPPRIQGIPDATVNVCGTAPYCYGPITSVDDEQNITSWALSKGPGTFDGQNWCYTPTGTQTVSAIFRAADACNRVVWDTLRVSFTSSATPVITFNSVSPQLCAPQTVCVPYSVSTGGGPAPVLSLIGPGTLDIANSRVCLPVSTSGIYALTLVATPACGLADTATATINATLNLPPQVTCAPTDIDTLAPGTEVCVSYAVTDPNGGVLDIDIQGPGFSVPRQSPSGTNGEICFSVVDQGLQTVRIIVSDGCDAADTCTTSFNVWFNAGPTVFARDTNVFLCTPQPICIAVTCSDPDDNLITCEAEGSKPGTFDGDDFCFTPDTAGTYTVDLYAADAFGSTATHTAIVRVSYNSPPNVQITGNDNVTVTAGETVCFNYTTSDPDGNLYTVTQSGDV